MIDKMTPEQEALLPKYRDEWFKIGTSCEDADRPTAEAAIIEHYKRADKPAPRFVWVESPREALEHIAKDNYDGNLEQARSEIWHALHGQTSAYWVAFYLFCRDVLGAVYERNDEFETWVALTKSAGWWWPYDEVCYVTERPREIHWEEVIDPERAPRLHNMSGPAVSFRDGYEVYCLRGIRVPRYYVMEPDKITVKEIEEQENQELRRLLIEQYGEGRYLEESGAVTVHQDDWGTLLRKEVADDEAIVMVRVLNSTPEPDGSIKTYYLRVPPTITTAHEGVAWTFQLDSDPKQYNPVVQT